MPSPKIGSSPAEDAGKLLKKYPERIPVVCEMPSLGAAGRRQKKLLIPKSMCSLEFATVARNHAVGDGLPKDLAQQLPVRIAGNLLCDEDFATTMQLLYERLGSPDGFLYVAVLDSEKQQETLPDAKAFVTKEATSPSIPSPCKAKSSENDCPAKKELPTNCKAQDKDAVRLLAKFPDRVPLLCGGVAGVQKKFLVPKKMPGKEFEDVVRKAARRARSEEVRLVAGEVPLDPSLCMGDIYESLGAKDGFLHLDLLPLDQQLKQEVSIEPPSQVSDVAGKEEKHEQFKPALQTGALVSAGSSSESDKDQQSSSTVEKEGVDEGTQALPHNEDTSCRQSGASHHLPDNDPRDMVDLSESASCIYDCLWDMSKVVSAQNTSQAPEEQGGEESDVRLAEQLELDFDKDRRISELQEKLAQQALWLEEGRLQAQQLLENQCRILELDNTVAQLSRDLGCEHVKCSDMAAAVKVAEARTRAVEKENKELRETFVQQQAQIQNLEDSCSRHAQEVSKCQTCIEELEKQAVKHKVAEGNFEAAYQKVEAVKNTALQQLSDSRAHIDELERSLACRVKEVQDLVGRSCAAEHQAEAARRELNKLREAHARDRAELLDTESAHKSHQGHMSEDVEWDDWEEVVA